MSANTPVIKHWYERPSAAMFVLVVGLILTVLLIVSTLAGTQSTAIVTVSEASIEQNVDAQVARYIAMGEWYGIQATNKAIDLELSNDANVARYAAMGEMYGIQAANEALDLQQGNEANTARYVAMGNWYENQATKEKAELQRGNEANVARYDAMAEFYNTVSK